MIENDYEKVETENDERVKLVDKSASLQYGTTAFGHCICDCRWIVMFRQIIKTSSSVGSIFFGLFMFTIVCNSQSMCIAVWYYTVYN